MSNLSFGVGVHVASPSQAYLPHVSTLSGPGTRPGIRPVIRKDHRRRSRSVLVALSCCLSATGVRFLGILSRPGNSALLTVGLPPARDFAERRTRARFPCSARLRPGWGGCPLYSGDDGVHATVAWSSVAACRLSTARSLQPRWSYPSQGLTMTKHQRGFTVIHPASLPLACSPRTEREPLGFPPSFTPGRAGPGHACQGGDRS